MLHNAHINLLTVCSSRTPSSCSPISYMLKLIPAHSTHTSPVRRGLLWYLRWPTGHWKLRLLCGSHTGCLQAESVLAWLATCCHRALKSSHNRVLTVAQTDGRFRFLYIDVKCRLLTRSRVKLWNETARPTHKPINYSLSYHRWTALSQLTSSQLLPNVSEITLRRLALAVRERS